MQPPLLEVVAVLVVQAVDGADERAVRGIHLVLQLERPPGRLAELGLQLRRQALCQGGRLCVSVIIAKIHRVLRRRPQGLRMRLQPLQDELCVAGALQRVTCQQLMQRSQVGARPIRINGRLAGEQPAQSRGRVLGRHACLRRVAATVVQKLPALVEALLEVVGLALLLEDLAALVQHRQHLAGHRGAELQLALLAAGVDDRGDRLMIARHPRECATWVELRWQWRQHGPSRDDEQPGSRERRECAATGTVSE